MNILIDMVHPADINFYKHAIKELSKHNKILITVMKRGSLPEKVKNEYPDSEVIILGEHKKGFLGKMLNMIARESLFLKLYKQRKFDVVTSFGFYPGMAAWLFGMKSVHFHDDKEYRLNYCLAKTFCTRFVSLCEKKSRGKMLAVKSYKELAYLHPKYFKEDLGILRKLGLEKERYAYIRDVSNISLNYSKEQKKDFSEIVKKLASKKLKVIFDSESSEKMPGTTSFNEPLTAEQMNAVKKNAAIIITSGDTVLREGALLGVPTIYTSSRKMAINKNLLDAGLFFQSRSSEQTITTIDMMLDPKVRKALQKKSQEHVKTRQDINKIIVQELMR